MNGKHEKHGFLKRVVKLCLVMMVLLTLEVFFISIRTMTLPDAGVLGVLMGAWCGELLMTLLKRKFDLKDKEFDKQDGDSK